MLKVDIGNIEAKRTRHIPWDQAGLVVTAKMLVVGKQSLMRPPRRVPRKK